MKTLAAPEHHLKKPPALKSPQWPLNRLQLHGAKTCNNMSYIQTHDSLTARKLAVMGLVCSQTLYDITKCGSRIFIRHQLKSDCFSRFPWQAGNTADFYTTFILKYEPISLVLCWNDDFIRNTCSRQENVINGVFTECSANMMHHFSGSLSIKHTATQRGLIPSVVFICGWYWQACSTGRQIKSRSVAVLSLPGGGPLRRVQCF